LSEAAPAGLSLGADEDQASGLRRIFDGRAANWTLVLQPPLRAGGTAESLAERARLLALHRGATLVIDASRTQVAAALGLRLRYDLEHALAGDCEVGEACAGAGGSLWVLPAARALDLAAADEWHGRRVAEALQAVAGGMREVVLVLPSSRIGWLRRHPLVKGIAEAVIPVYGSADTGTAVLTTVRQAAADLDIFQFHLLFLGMGEATAGRLLTAMAAIASRHFGATLRAARPLGSAPGAPGETRSRRAGRRAVERLF
jgi:hypothetical protein